MRPPLLVTAAALCVPGLLDAQSRSVAGVVADSVSGKTVSGAVLYFEMSGGDYRSGSDGAFAIADVPGGDTLLIVRRIGYVPRRVVVPVSPSAARIDVGRILLRPVATKLDEIAVEAEEVRLFPQLAEFYRRKQQGTKGWFITREDIERSGVRKPGELMRRTASVEMDCPNDPVKSGDECVARSRRGRDVRIAGTGRRPQTGAMGSGSGGGWSFDRCEMDVVVDGLRVTMKVDEIPLEQIAAIEVYAGAGTAPAVLGNSRCGIVAIWTRQGRGN